MDLLQLVQRSCQRCGIHATGPASLSNITGRHLEVKQWVNESWIELQQQNREWNFMQADFEAQLVEGTSIYRPAVLNLNNVSFWRRDTFRIWRTEFGQADEGHLMDWDFNVFRDTYQYGVMAPGRPAVFTVRPEDMALMVGPTPDAGYTVRGRYVRTAVEMTDSGPGSTPLGLPEEFHMLLVYMVMQRYAGDSNAPEVYYSARAMHGKLFDQLCQRQLPDMMQGTPLA